MSIVANEDQALTNQGSRIEFWVTPNGNSSSNIANVAVLTSSLLSVKTDLSINGNIIVTGSNSSNTQQTNKSTTVTVNGRSGQITMNPATLNAGAFISFTVLNNYVASVNDVVVLIIQNSVASPNIYSTQVSNVAVGSFGVTLFNQGVGAGNNRGDAVVLNFAVIRVS
jgi:hypothetical protein